MKGQLYEADGRIDQIQNELATRTSQLSESRDQIKTL